MSVARETGREPAPAGGVSGLVIALLTAAMFVNYADRGSLSVVSPVLGQRLDLSSAEIGALFSAFFWSYAAAQPFAGAIAQRFNVRWVLAAGLATWAGATALCGLAMG